jgi:hypothetical protein
MYQPANSTNDSERMLPRPGKLYAAGISTSTVECASSPRLCRSASISLLHCAASSGSTISTLPAANAVMSASRKARSTSMYCNGVTTAISPGSTQKLSRIAIVK